VALYVCAVQGTADVERQALFEKANLSIEESQMITNLHILGVRLSPSMEKKQGFNPFTTASLVERAPKTFEFENSKYKPAVYYIIKDQITNKLPHDVFSWIKEPPPVDDRPAYLLFILTFIELGLAPCLRLLPLELNPLGLQRNLQIIQINHCWSRNNLSCHQVQESFSLCWVE
jgi:hypothetical protein